MRTTTVMLQKDRINIMLEAPLAKIEIFQNYSNVKVHFLHSLLKLFKNDSDLEDFQNFGS